MSDLCVFTTDYDTPKIDMSLLRRSCEDHGIKLHTYGAGSTWPGMGHGKIRDACEFLKGRNETYALFTDAADSFIVSFYWDLRHRILNLIEQTGIVMSCEKNCWPDGDLAAAYPACDSSWQYINAGGWAGERERLIAILEELQQMECYREGDDQHCWHQWYVRNPSRATLDSECRVFQTMANTYAIINGKNVVTGYYPSVFHFNGRCAGKEQMEWHYERWK